MIIVLYGPDDYRREERTRALVAAFEKKYSRLGTGIFDGEDDLQGLGEFLENRSLFERAKIAVLHNVNLLSKESAKKLVSTLRGIKEGSGTSVVVSEHAKPAAAFAPLFKSPARVEEFPVLKDIPWRNFVKKLAEQEGVSLDEGAMRFLLEAYEGDSWRIVTELRKLALLGASPVGISDLKQLSIERAPDVWNLIRGLAGYDIRERLTSLELLFSSREPAAKLFFVLAALLKQKSGAFASQDVLIKSGKLDYEEALLQTAL